MEEENKTPFRQDDSLYNKKIKAVPPPPPKLDVDVDNEMFENILSLYAAGKAIDINSLSSFTQVTQRRSALYDLLDTMAEDARIAAILETYAEDATEANEQGKIVWSTSSDEEVQRYITQLISMLNIDRYVYQWVYSLCKYGDVYIRMYRDSDMQTGRYLLDDAEDIDGGKQPLKEDVVLKVYDKTDHYSEYVEMVPNPAEMFELIKFGKSCGYIQAPSSVLSQKQQSEGFMSTYMYKFKKSDVDVYSAKEFVHASLGDFQTRAPEEVEIVKGDTDNEETFKYRVKRGTSILAPVFKVWRELMLMEQSMLLNRATRSSILRIFQIEVADMDKTMVGPHLQGIKSLVEQKAALDTNNSYNEYTNPGPVENSIYLPVRNGVGGINVQTIGGDVSVKDIADIDYFKNVLYGAERIPKQYFGDTDDATGFNGGTSLSIISSRYAKTVKHVQSAILQAVTTMINLVLIDRKQYAYIGRFDLHMTAPTTQEEIDRRESLASKISVVGDIMNLCADLQSTSAKMRILKALFADQNIISDSEVLELMAKEIEKMEKQEALAAEMEAAEAEGGELPGGDDLGGLDDFDFNDIDAGGTEAGGPEGEGGGDTGDTLPSPSDLGVDLTDNNAV